MFKEKSSKEKVAKANIDGRISAPSIEPIHVRIMIDVYDDGSIHLKPQSLMGFENYFPVSSVYHDLKSFNNVAKKDFEGLYMGMKSTMFFIVDSSALLDFEKEYKSLFKKLESGDSGDFVIIRGEFIYSKEKPNWSSKDHPKYPLYRFKTMNLAKSYIDKNLPKGNYSIIPLYQKM